MIFLFVLMILCSYRAEAQDDTLNDRIDHARIFYQQGHLDEAKRVYFDILSKEELSFEERSIVLYNIATILIADEQYKESEKTFDLIDEKKISNPLVLASIEENRSICYLKIAEQLIEQPIGHDNFVDRIGEVERYINMARSSYDKALIYNSKIDKTNTYDMRALYEEIINVEKKKDEKLFSLSIATKKRDILTLEFIDYIESLISTTEGWRSSIDPSNSIKFYLKSLEHEVKTKFTVFFKGIGITQNEKNTLFGLLQNTIYNEKNKIIEAFRTSSIDELIHSLSLMELYIKIYYAYLSQDEIREALKLRFELDCLNKNSKESNSLLQKEIEELDSFIIQLIEKKQEEIEEMIQKVRSYRTLFPNELFRLNFQYNLLKMIKQYLKKEKNQHAYYFYNALQTQETKILEDLIEKNTQPGITDDLLISALGERLEAKSSAEKFIGKNDVILKLKKMDLFKESDKKELLSSEIQAYSILDSVSLRNFLLARLEYDAKNENLDDFNRLYPYFAKYFGASKELDASFKMLSSDNVSLKYIKFLWHRIILSLKEIEWKLNENIETMLKLGIEFEEEAINLSDLYREDEDEIVKQISYSVLSHSLYKVFENSMDHMLWLKEFLQKQHVASNRQNLIIRSIEDLEKFGVELQKDMKISSIEDPKKYRLFHEKLKEVFSKSEEMQNKKEDLKNFDNHEQTNEMQKKMIAPNKPFQLSPSQAIRFVLEMESDDPSFKMPIHEREEGVYPW